MKKTIILISIISSSLVFAQNDQPAEIDGKDFIEDVNKPEFDNSDIEVNLDEFIPKMEMPVLVPQMETQDEPSARSQSPRKTDNKKEAKPTAKIINAATELKIQDLKVNDLIRIEFSQIKVYRRDNKNILKYKFRNGLNLKSSGLNKKDDTTYYVDNVEQLISDTKSAKAQQQRPTLTQAEKETTELAEDTNEVTNDEAAIAELRANVEKQLNNGKAIKDEIEIRRLRTNDLIYIIGDLQLVTRKNKATSGLKKYWLVEPIDTNNKSLEKEANNRYKVLRKYQN